MSKIKIALVSYINTIPFIEGIKMSDSLNAQMDLIIDYPAKCAELIMNNEVDGGLIPVGALLDLPNYQIITDYCIGADGRVDTVALFSHQSLGEVDTIYLDYQSRTSVKLVQILAQKYWKKNYTFLPTEKGFETTIPDKSAILIIGDRVFKYEHLFPYKLDLAEEWKKHTGLPFAFAVWVGNERLVKIEKELNKAFKMGLLDVSKYYNDLLTIDKEKFVNYLVEKIDYSLDNKKKEAIQLFTSLLNSR